MATQKIVILWFRPYLNLYMEFLGDLKGWVIQLAYEQSIKIYLLILVKTLICINPN